MNSQSSIFSFNLSKKYLIWHMYQIQQLEEKICCVGKSPFMPDIFLKQFALELHNGDWTNFHMISAHTHIKWYVRNREFLFLYLRMQQRRSCQQSRLKLTLQIRLCPTTKMFSYGFNFICSKFDLFVFFRFVLSFEGKDKSESVNMGINVYAL